MPAPVAGIHVLIASAIKAWMARTSPAMTQESDTSQPIPHYAAVRGVGAPHRMAALNTTAAKRAPIASLPRHRHAAELLPPRLHCKRRRLRSVEADMEKLVLLCLIIATIGALAETAPVRRQHD